MDLDARLTEATRKRDALDAECKRIEGRLEAARSSLATLEKECRDRGLDPDRLDEAIATLESRFQTLVAGLETDLAAASAALAPFQKEM